jgi:hypothetical protein
MRHPRDTGYGQQQENVDTVKEPASRERRKTEDGNSIHVPHYRVGIVALDGVYMKDVDRRMVEMCEALMVGGGELKTIPPKKH